MVTMTTVVHEADVMAKSKDTSIGESRSLKRKAKDEDEADMDVSQVSKLVKLCYVHIRLLLSSDTVVFSIMNLPQSGSI